LDLSAKCCLVSGKRYEHVAPTRSGHDRKVYRRRTTRTQIAARTKEENRVEKRESAIEISFTARIAKDPQTPQLQKLKEAFTTSWLPRNEIRKYPRLAGDENEKRRFSLDESSSQI